MDENPYAPPKPEVVHPDAVQPPMRLSQEMELRAMQELGRLRSRAGTRAFAVAWFGCIVVFTLSGLGLIWALVVGAAAGGAISKLYVKSRKDAMVDAVCRELNIPRGSFAPDQYLID